jgi:DNA-binding SARP family transcriptional activator/pimeloyl-ACP methyl ester carboxylesterase
MLKIRLLGEMEVARGTERLVLPPSKKTRALLAYLAATGRPHRRERLCQLLWNVPDDPRGALRWSLSKIRALSGEAEKPLVVADRDSVTFDPTTAVVDLPCVRQSLSGGIEAASTERLQQVAAAFQGEFLEGLVLADCHDFRSWCVAEREDSRAIQVRALAALVERMAADPEAAFHYARALVQVDPEGELSWALLVRSLAAAGRRREAEEQYETGSQALRQAGVPSDALSRAWREARAAPATVVSVLSAAEASDTHANITAQPVVPMAAAEAPAAPRQEIRFCIAADGVRVAYATVGSGPPLVKPASWLTHLEHDWHSPVWRHWMEELSRDHRLVRYDERGNGLSDWVVEDLDFDVCVRDLEAVVDAAGLGRFPMLGVSQGCASAVSYAVRHPERVSGLVLYGGYARGWAMRGTPAEVARRTALATLIQHGWGEENAAFRQTFTTLFIPGATSEQMRWFNDLQRVTASAANAFRLHDMFGQIQVEALLPQVRVPTLVLHCRDDGVVPFEEGRRIAMAVPGARFVPLEGRNHILLETEPAWPRFLAEVRAFLAAEDP